MKRFRWLLVALAFLAFGITSLLEAWNGNANATMAWPPAGASVSFCGSAHGWPALLGVVMLFLGVIFLIVGVVSVATAEPASPKS